MFNLKSVFFILIVILINKIFGLNLNCNEIDVNNRINCFPDNNANQKECLSRKCCWHHLNDSVPSCFFPKDFPNYKVVSFETNKPNELVYLLEKQNLTFRQNEILKLETKVIFETGTRLRVQITDPKNNRYQVPFFKNHTKQHSKFEKKIELDYDVLVNNDPFYIRVYRKKTGKLVFDSSIAPLIYADQFIQFSTKLNNNIFYGIGEREYKLAHETNWNRYTLWNRDITPRLNTNLYGTHPFFMSLDHDGNAMGFFFLNSNAMEIHSSPMPSLTFITIGGIIDFYIYMGPSPSDVISQHTEVIGRSQLPQYFTLGFHLCRWGYFSSEKLAEVIKRNRLIGIPYDTQWTDIDVMSERLDWTYDTKKFHSLQEIVKDLHENGQHYINIIDPAINNKPGYYPYDSGIKQNVFIKSFNKTDNLIGFVWPGRTVYPDFTNPNTSDWWLEQAKIFHDIIPYDGLWIDMNEPSNFVDGSVNGCIDNNYDNPPYVPKLHGYTLKSRTICPSSQQHLSLHYNLHNMYGHFEAIATYNALRSIDKKKRPFVLTRSSFSGTGQYAAHWSGDNKATWDDLYYSIPMMLSFNMFGISQVGADICGFTGETTEELCIRWMQLGSFYPFMRNHNFILDKDQDPAVFSQSAQDYMKKTLKIRYDLLPYLYNLYYRSNQFGETFVRPLFFEFQIDFLTHHIDRQFMVGPALLITPVLEKGAIKVKGYFPNDTWYDYHSGSKLDLSKYNTINLDAPLSKINIHVRGGFIIPFQNSGLTTTDSRKNNFGLIVALKQNGSDMFANGDLFWDDGESIDSIESKRYNYFVFVSNKDRIVINRIFYGFETKMFMSDLKIFGVNNEVKQVIINDYLFKNFTYDNQRKVLMIQSFNLNMLDKKDNTIVWL